MPLKFLNRRPEALHISADGFRLTQCEMDCLDCFPIRMSQNSPEVDDELGEEEQSCQGRAPASTPGASDGP